MSQYPEHKKLRAVEDQVEAIGAFLEFLDGKGISIVRFIDTERYCPEWESYASSQSRNKLIGEYFGVDPDALEKEKRAILEEIRSNH